MTYLIALIIAIALGAVIALLSFVNIGSGFSGQSAAAKAQQFSQAGSQLEIAMASYRASEAGSAYDAAATQDFAGTTDELVSEEWLKEIPVAINTTAPFTMLKAATGSNVYLIAQGAGVTTDICTEIVDLSGVAATDLSGAVDDAAVVALVLASGARLTCGVNDSAVNVAVFRVE